MGRLLSILSFFHNNFDKFIITGEQKLDSNYHMTFKLLLSCIFGMKTLGFCHYLCIVVMDVM